MAYAYSPRSGEAETGRSLQLPAQATQHTRWKTYVRKKPNKTHSTPQEQHSHLSFNLHKGLPTSAHISTHTQAQHRLRKSGGGGVPETRSWCRPFSLPPPFVSAAPALWDRMFSRLGWPWGSLCRTNKTLHCRSCSLPSAEMTGACLCAGITYFRSSATPTFPSSFLPHPFSFLLGNWTQTQVFCSFFPL